MDEPSLRRLTARIAALWPPGPYALASAAAAVVEAMAGRSRRVASCFVAPDTASGTRARTAALPVRFNTEGIASILQPSLSVVERVALDNAMQV
jgi:malate/lactate dehydrogenase